ncbi:MAG: S41 family peptidase, partial [Acutalibacteraceae bacterium]
GISYAIDSKSGLPYVTMVHRGSSADTSGIKIGDYIIGSSAGTADDIGVDEMLKALEGSSGDTKSLTVKRGNEQLNFVCTVSQFEITSVTYSVEENIGIVKISAFNTLTVSQFKDAIAELTSQEITGIIFDVRHNSGGVMSAAKDILDIILPEGTLYTAEYSDGTAETFTSDAACIDLPMAVLIDEKTASAAEMFAAAIKDYYAGALVGMKTYGKGVMQRTYSLSDDSMITITIAYFNSPKGINYDGVGIEPNFTVALSEEAADRFFILSYDEDIQLQTAVGLLNN